MNWRFLTVHFLFLPLKSVIRLSHKMVKKEKKSNIHSSLLKYAEEINLNNFKAKTKTHLHLNKTKVQISWVILRVLFPTHRARLFKLFLDLFQQFIQFSFKLYFNALKSSSTPKSFYFYFKELTVKTVDKLEALIKCLSASVFECFICCRRVFICLIV